jgi:hypothetical protein
MDNKIRQPGLDGRHRDQNGRITEKHGNTRIDTLRETYGAGFAGDFRRDAHLRTVLDRAGAQSLSELIKKRRMFASPDAKDVM